MTVEALANHLERPVGRGHTPARALTGAAGGAACGDLVRVSLALDPDDPQGRIADAGFDASGCGAAIAAGSATVSLRARHAAAGRRARRGRRDRRGARRAEPGQAPRRRARGRRAAPRARRRGAHAGAAGSGGAAHAGRDERRRRQRRRGAADRAGGPARSWRSRSSCGRTRRTTASAAAARRRPCAARARSRTTSGCRTSRSTCARSSAPASSTPGWPTTPPGLTPNPCVRCNGNVRLDAMLELRRAPGRRAARHRPLRARARGRAGPAAADRRRPAKDQSYMLAGLAPESLARLRFPLGELHKAQVRELAEREGLAGRAQARLPGPVLPGRHRAVALPGPPRRPSEPGGAGSDRRRRRAASSAATAARTVHGRPAPRPRDRRRRAAVRAGHRSAREHRDGRPARGAADAHRDRARRHAAPRRRHRGRRAGALPRAPCMPCRLARDRRAGQARGGSTSRLPEPIVRAAPGQLACLYAGELIVGHGDDRAA